MRLHNLYLKYWTRALVINRNEQPDAPESRIFAQAFSYRRDIFTNMDHKYPIESVESLERYTLVIIIIPYPSIARRPPRRSHVWEFPLRRNGNGHGESTGSTLPPRVANVKSRENYSHWQILRWRSNTDRPSLKLGKSQPLSVGNFMLMTNSFNNTRRATTRVPIEQKRFPRSALRIRLYLAPHSSPGDLRHGGNFPRNLFRDRWI